MNHTVYILDFSDCLNPKLTTTNVRYLPASGKNLQAYFIAPGSIKADWIARGNRAYIDRILAKPGVYTLPLSNSKTYWSLHPSALVEGVVEDSWCTRLQLAPLFPDHPELSI